jgi:phage gp46-like protein
MTVNNLQTFEGDLLLEDTPDGGDIRIEDGLFVSDRSFRTAVYLSLFGGNKEDNGKVRNRKTWWGNTLRGVSENQKLVSRFQAIIHGLPMTTKNILDAEDAAKMDLKWMADDGIADEIIANGRAVSHSRFELEVQINAKGNALFGHTYALFWKAGSNGKV